MARLVNQKNRKNKISCHINKKDTKLKPKNKRGNRKSIGKPEVDGKSEKRKPSRKSKTAVSMEVEVHNLERARTHIYKAIH